MDPTDLYSMPSSLSEVIVATKEVSEKTRDVAYDLLVAMGHKMKSGGIISSERVGDMEGAPSETQATISEYFTMVTADLAVSEMISTMHLFVNSSNHEIVKLALGFIKVTTISLDVEIVKVRHILEPLVRHRENQEQRAAYQQTMESANSRRSYGLHSNHLKKSPSVLVAAAHAHASAIAANRKRNPIR
ncbi:MAG: hypothetical protein J3Q66DRAFT_440243 [Benniella sp.]|nr:MAG: hypothetical protein J3Q66DRAFT_440243 [Benniella sp.]